MSWSREVQQISQFESLTTFTKVGSSSLQISVKTDVNGWINIDCDTEIPNEKLFEMYPGKWEYWRAITIFNSRIKMSSFEMWTAHLESIAKFLEFIIDHHQLWGTEISTQLYSLCKLSIPHQEIALILTKKLNDDNIEEVIREAVNYQYQHQPEVIWDFRNHLLVLIEQNHTKLTLNHLYFLYDNIEAHNPHFQEAQVEKFHLLMMQPITPENRIDFLEEKFKVALASQQLELANRLFEELCGEKLSVEPLIIHPHSNGEMLCQIAGKMRTLNHQVAQLELENTALKTSATKSNLFEIKKSPVTARLFQSFQTTHCPAPASPTICSSKH